MEPIFHNNYSFKIWKMATGCVWYGLLSCKSRWKSLMLNG